MTHEDVQWGWTSEHQQIFKKIIDYSILKVTDAFKLLSLIKFKTCL
jgi:hypothetical protein